MWTAFVLCSGGVNAEVYDNVLASIVNYSAGRKELESLHNLLSVRGLFWHSSLASQIGGVWESPVCLGGMWGCGRGSFHSLICVFIPPWYKYDSSGNMDKQALRAGLKQIIFFQLILITVKLINLNGSISQMVTCCQHRCCCHWCHFKNVVFHAYALNVPLLFFSGGKDQACALEI